MGKKSKKSNKTLDIQVPVTNEHSTEQEDINLNKSKKRKKIMEDSVITDNNSADSMNTKKKKRKHASADIVSDTSVQAAIEERIQAVHDELDNPTTLEPKKKKKKKHLEKDSELEKTQFDNVSTDINTDESDILKKKKKKNKVNPLVEEEIKHDIGQVKEEHVENETKISMKKKNKGNLLNGDSVTEGKSIENVSVKEKSKITKSQKKKKTGTAVLNAEESQVTEEAIDRFCDDLDEEDNKQYEDWVKLIEASLPPPRQNT